MRSELCCTSQFKHRIGLPFSVRGKCYGVMLGSAYDCYSLSLFSSVDCDGVISGFGCLVGIIDLLSDCLMGLRD
jgi:hypothetical protein